jgi:CMP-N-acetylneuraminic acid synthetase
MSASCWALIPARGGSKSIPRKNLALIQGRPMLDFGINAARASGAFDRIICSTDDAQIAERAASFGIEVHRRPAQLATDTASVTDVAIDLLKTAGAPAPELLALVQPTSPFVLGTQIRRLCEAVAADPSARSGQTVHKVPHNYHAWNQRIVRDGYVEFKHPEERKIAYSKQRKPELHAFGNLIVVRCAALLGGEGFFATPSVAIEVPWPYYLDVDGPEDLKVAELMLAAGLVDLDAFDRSGRPLQPQPV